MATNSVIGALRVNLGLDTAEFQNGVKAVKSQFAGLSKMFAGLAAAGVFTAFSAGIGQAVGRIEEMRKLSAQLDRALENTGNTAKTSASEVANFADELERSTGRAAEEVMAVSTNLATFGFSRDVFFDAIELADDMAAAWGGDLKQNVEGLARALADPEKGLAMLTKRGITFTDEQKKLIASFMQANDLIGAQGVVMDALNEQVKGVAAAGFSGLTKATANAWKGVEDFFEAIAGGFQLNLGLEMGLIAVAEALRFVTDNLGLLGRAVAVAGTALATAMGPAVWSAISAAAVAFGQAAVAAIRAVGGAIAANPIGAIVVALSAAVSAAFLFRDEIKRVIGIDFVGIIQGAANNLIGLFVGAYRAITGAFGLIPEAFAQIFTRAMNAAIDVVQSGINHIVGLLRQLPGLDDLEVNLEGWKRDGGGDAVSNLLSTIQREFQAGFSRNYFAELGSLFAGVGDEASGAAANVQGFGDILSEMSGGGSLGAAKAATDGFSQSLQDAARWGDQLSSSLASGFTDMFMGVIDGTKSVAQSFGDMFRNIGQQFLQSGLQRLFSGLFGGMMGGGTWGVAGGFAGFPGIFGLPSFDGGGFTWTGPRSGGLDGKGGRLAMLHPNETVLDHSKGQGGASRLHITTGVAVDGQGSISSYVKSVVQDGIDIFNQALPDRVQQINADPRAR